MFRTLLILLPLAVAACGPTPTGVPCNTDKQCESGLTCVAIAQDSKTLTCDLKTCQKPCATEADCATLSDNNLHHCGPVNAACTTAKYCQAAP